MLFNTSFLKTLNRIVDNSYGGDADIKFSFVSEKTMKFLAQEAKKSKFIKILYESECFLIIDIRVDEDVICYINKDNQSYSVYFFTDEVLAQNKVIREKNKKHFAKLKQ